MANEYKALTYVNLPFIEERFSPGQTIPHEAIERMAEQIKSTVDDRSDVDENASPILSAEEHVQFLIDGGAISEDPDAEIHPDHQPADPNKPTLTTLVERAAAMVAEMEEKGQKVPKKLRDFAEISDRQISAADHATGGES